MKYTRVQFGKQLKERLLLQQDVSEIGHWAYVIYLEHIEDIEGVDNGFRKILLNLNSMEDGHEFARSYQQLNEIADDLIAGREVNLAYK